MPDDKGAGRRFRLQKAPREEAATPAKHPAKQPTVLPPSQAGDVPVQGNNPAMMASQNAPGAGPITPTILSQQIASQTGAITQELARLRGEIELMQHAMVELGERESKQEKVFNVLHKELNDYKTDFIYEHLKPVIRPLLFLYDSIEQFEAEVEPFERQEAEERRTGFSPTLVRQNAQFFRDQLAEALLVCEVTLMDPPRGQFDPKLQKAVDVVEVPPELENTVQRVVRSGWYLRGQLFRPAEVVVGRSTKKA